MAHDSAIHRFWDVIERIDTCMVVTRSSRGMEAVPMTGRANRSSSTIHVYPGQDPGPDGLMSDASICLTYVDSSDRIYVSVVGAVRVPEANLTAANDRGGPAPSASRTPFFLVEPREAAIWEPEGDLLQAIERLTSTKDGAPDHSIGDPVRVVFR